ncbi:MAG: hypothetical protein ACR2NC_04485 [Thermodesulfobacteriota bacterium]
MNFNDISSKIRLAKQYLAEKLEEALNSERDRRAIYVGVAIISFVVLFAFYNTFIKNSNKYQKQSSAIEEQLLKVKSLKNEFKQSRQKLNELSKTVKKEDEALISVVEKILVDNQIERTSFSIKDSKLGESYSEELTDESTVQVDLRKIPFNKVIDILYSIQSRESFLKVSNLRLKTKFDKPEQVDVSFKLSTFEIGQGV